MNKWIGGFSVTIFCAGLTACINLAPNSGVDTHGYMLDVQAPQAMVASAIHTDKVVMVNVGASTPEARSIKINYQQKDHQLQAYALHHWFAPPITMINSSVARALTASGAFKAVVSAPLYAGAVDDQVSIQLQTLQQNFSGNQSVERLVMQVVVVNMHTGRVIAAQTFSAEKNAAPNPVAGVAAANEVLSLLMPKIVQFVVQSVS